MTNTFYQLPSKLRAIPAYGLVLAGLTLSLCACKPGANRSTLTLGQTIDDVRTILGKPQGTIVSSNQTVLLYPAGTLIFNDGKLSAPRTERLVQIQEQQAGR